LREAVEDALSLDGCADHLSAVEGLSQLRSDLRAALAAVEPKGTGFDRKLSIAELALRITREYDNSAPAVLIDDLRKEIRGQCRAHDNAQTSAEAEAAAQEPANG
jgi:hypothetical protein